MTDGRYQNSREHCQRAKTLRRQSPLSERLLWNAISAGKLNGWKFRRQHPLSPYVADFACIKARLIVELDGASHDARQAYDEKRDYFLHQQGWTILRFSNDEVMTNTQGVIFVIEQKVFELITRPPLAPPASGRGTRLKAISS